MEGGIIEDDGSLLPDEYVFVRIHGRNADYMQERSHSCQHHAYPISSSSSIVCGVSLSLPKHALALDCLGGFERKDKLLWIACPWKLIGIGKLIEYSDDIPVILVIKNVQNVDWSFLWMVK